MVFSPWKHPYPHFVSVYLLVVLGKYLIAEKLAISVTWNYHCRSWSIIIKKLFFATSGQIFKDNQILINNFSWLR